MFNIKNNPFSDLQSLEKLTDSEIITPFEVVKKMVELLPEEVFTNLNNRFIDVSTKSGIYLKYIFFNLLHKLPNIQLSKNNNQLDYELDEDYDFTNLDDKKKFILRYMIYGIATSELSFLTSKRTLYENINENEDSEKNGKILSKPIFKNWEGNIIYKKLNNEEYWFLETDIETINKELTKNIILKKDKEMKFNVIIGNPPYQINNGGGKGASADPIYQKFMEKAIEMDAKYISMITPSRWFSGNKPEFIKFRKYIKNSKINFSKIYDYKNSKECFSNVVIDGGVNFFLIINNKTMSNTRFVKMENGIETQNQSRKLFEDDLDCILRDNKSVSIIQKVQIEDGNSFSSIVSSQDPFGFDKRIKGTKKRQKIEKFEKFEKGMVKYLDRRDKEFYINKNQINKNKDKITNYKIVIEKAIKKKLFPILLGKNEVCSETFLCCLEENKTKAINIQKYMNTNFFNFLFYSKKLSHNSSKLDFNFIPILDMNEEWTDTKLYKRYNLTKEEISYIELSIEELV